MFSICAPPGFLASSHARHATAATANQSANSRQKQGAMSGPLDSMSSLAAANSEAGLQQRLNSPELWRRLQLFRLAVMSSSSSGESSTRAAEGREKRAKLALGLLKDVDLRLLFVAVDFSHGQAGDETKQGAVEIALLCVLGSSVGQELLQEVCGCAPAMIFIAPS